MEVERNKPRAVFMAFGTKGDVYPVAVLPLTLGFLFSWPIISSKIKLYLFFLLILRLLLLLSLARALTTTFSSLLMWPTRSLAPRFIIVFPISLFSSYPSFDFLSSPRSTGSGWSSWEKRSSVYSCFYATRAIRKSRWRWSPWWPYSRRSWPHFRWPLTLYSVC